MKKNILFTLLLFIALITSCKYDVLTQHLELSSASGYKWQMIKHSDITEDLSTVSDIDYDASNWETANIPGTVLNNLVQHGHFPEPYYGLNNKITLDSIPDISQGGREFYHYAFRTEFDLPTSFAGKELWLQLNGINYIANLYVNGEYLGDMKGMFKSEKFNISEIANYGNTNVLLVDVEPVEHPGEPMAIIGKDNVVQKENRNGGNGDIGKDVTMLMSIGWDFTFSDGIRDRNTGIWQPVNIFTSGDIQVSNPFVKTDLNLPDTTISYQTVIADVSNTTDASKEAEVLVQIPERKLLLKKVVKLDPHETKEVVFTHKEYPKLVFENPKLWWPFGKGCQNLYKLNIIVKDENKHSDKISTRFGIRTITSDRNTPDSSRLFYVNGDPFFVNGGNWIPEGMLRKSKQRTKAQLLYTRQSGINFLRLWGGGISEDEYFYNLCDSLGIIIWHEFWMTGDTKAPVDQELYFTNVRSTIKRIRNHPSMGYYVSSNEQDAILSIESILNELDGTRGYQHQSECCGVHDGSPYKYENPMQYYDNTASDRGSRIDGFCPEYGTVCLPPIECLREMMDERDIFPPSKPVWDYLDGNGFHNMTTKYLDAIKRYGDPSSAEDLALKGQLAGAMAYRGVWENWNYNRLGAGDRWTSGVLFWYHNSPVRQVCGRMWTWSLEPTAALYVTQKAHSSLHIQFDYFKNTVSVINNKKKPIDGLTAKVRVYNFDSKLEVGSTKTIDLKGDEVKNDICSIEFPDNISNIHFIALELLKDGKVLADNFYWRSNKEYEGPWTTTGPAYDGFQNLFDLKKVTLEVDTSKPSYQKIEVVLKNTCDYISFFNRIKVLNKEGELVRPVFYSDNYFSILPGGEKKIILDLSLTELTAEAVDIELEGVNSKLNSK